MGSKINCFSCGREIEDNQKWEMTGDNYFHKGHNIYHDKNLTTSEVEK